MRKAVMFMTVLALAYTPVMAVAAPQTDEQVASGGEFTTACAISHSAPDDPIVFPNRPGAAHLHDFFGNVSTDAYTTYKSLRSAATTCESRPKDTAAYWIPALLYDDVEFLPEFTRVYYRGTGIDDDATIQPFPKNLRIIAGDMHAASPQDISIVSWACTIPGGGAAGDEVEVAEVPDNCDDQPLRMRVVFPQCWDGVHKDSSDHQSHMTYAVDGSCPAAHRVAVPQATFSTRYWLTGDLRGHVRLTSMNSPYTGHGDFINAWPQRHLEALVKDCINAGVDCDPVL